MFKKNTKKKIRNRNFREKVCEGFIPTVHRVPVHTHHPWKCCYFLLERPRVLCSIFLISTCDNQASDHFLCFLCHFCEGYITCIRKYPARVQSSCYSLIIAGLPSCACVVDNPSVLDLSASCGGTSWALRAPRWASPVPPPSRARAAPLAAATSRIS